MRLTTRDFEILEFLSSQGAATSSQIAQRFFPTQKSFKTRIAILKKEGLVESVRANVVKSISTIATKNMADVLSARERALWRYRIYRLGPRFRPRRLGAASLSDPRMWRHQLQLNGVRSLCEELFPDGLILTDPEIRMEWSRFGGRIDVPIPDLVIRGQGSDIAIELERSLKRERAYYERFQQYRASHYTHVIYFCENDRIFKRVSEMATRFKKIAVSSLLAKETVFQGATGFRSLKEFLAIKPINEGSDF